jgi:hypothetical protein
LLVIRASPARRLRIQMHSCSFSYAASLAFQRTPHRRQRIRCRSIQCARMAPDG